MPSPRTTRYHGVYKASKTTYKYVVDLDRTPTGKRRQESRGGYRTAQDAHEDRIKRLAELHRGIATDPSRQTVAEYLTDWLRLRAHSIRPSTQRTYRVVIQHRITPYLGTHLLGKLAPSHLRAWHAALTPRHAPGSINQAHTILSMALGDALDDGTLARNVARLVPAPAPTPRARTVWSLPQVAAFLAVADRDTEAALWRVAVLTGLRRGELFALRWSDVDLKARTLTVRNTVTVDARGQQMIGPAKSTASQATLELDDSCVAALKAQKKRVAEMHMAARYWDDDFVFCRADGRSLAATTVRARLRGLCEAAGVPPCAMHQLRHACGSALYEMGIDLKTIQGRLRHARLSITSDVYVHGTEGRQRAAAEGLAAALAKLMVPTTDAESG